MMKYGIIILVGAIVGAYAQHYGGDNYYDHGSSYDFKYEVHDPYHHDIKSQSESKVGGVVKGHYSLKETDGSTRDVVYTADKHSGFQAVVHKDGHQVFPEIVTKAQYAIPLHGGGYSRPQQSYYQPQPAYYQPQPAYHQPQPAYYQPQPAYHQPQPAYYQPQPQEYHGPVHHYSY